jgi:hypothetical protein
VIIFVVFEQWVERELAELRLGITQWWSAGSGYDAASMSSKPVTDTSPGASRPHLARGADSADRDLVGVARERGRSILHGEQFQPERTAAPNREVATKADLELTACLFDCAPYPQHPQYRGDTARFRDGATSSAGIVTRVGPGDVNV